MNTAIIPSAGWHVTSTSHITIITDVVQDWSKARSCYDRLNSNYLGMKHYKQPHTPALASATK